MKLSILAGLTLLTLAGTAVAQPPPGLSQPVLGVATDDTNIERRIAGEAASQASQLAPGAGVAPRPQNILVNQQVVDGLRATVPQMH